MSLDIMPDDELIERMRSYRGKGWKTEDSAVTQSDLLELAGINRSDWAKFCKGKKRFNSTSTLRLTKVVVMAETGCISKIGGVLHVGTPTRSMPPRVKLSVSSAGPRIAPAAEPQRQVGGLPSFKGLFSRG